MNNYGSGRAAPARVVVEFFAYVGLRHTIRLRDNAVLVRLSDLMQNAPLAAHEALAAILVAKLLKKRVPPAARQIYENFARQTDIAEQSKEQRKQRGRKNLTAPRGAVYDLEEIFIRLNRDFFQNSIKKPLLSWSTRRTFRIFGHHDATHGAIVVSKTLDDVRVPRFVAEFVLYHELLHIKHPTEQRHNGRRTIHSAVFRREERLFPHFEEAEKWLALLAKKKR